MPIIGAVIVPHPPLIIPTVGQGRERQVQDTIDAYCAAVRRGFKRLIPSHRHVRRLFPHLPRFGCIRKHDLLRRAPNPFSSDL